MNNLMKEQERLIEEQRIEDARARKKQAEEAERKRLEMEREHERQKQRIRDQSKRGFWQQAGDFALGVVTGAVNTITAPFKGVGKIFSSVFKRRW